MIPRRPCLGLLVAVLVCVGLPVAPAHEGPEHEIDELTERLKVDPDSVDLLFLRAVEYRVWGKPSEAARDLERVLVLDPESIRARRELSRTYFALGKTNEALGLATQVLERKPKPDLDPVERASVLIIRAGFLRARGDFAAAETDADEAIRLHGSNPEWYLFRSDLQRCRGRTRERIRGLEAGLRETGSGFLVGEWVDALIDAREDTRASERIERELGESRWRAAWLIRRGKLRWLRDDRDGARSDLESAVQELDLRLGPRAQDALLLADRAKAYELLGEISAARRDYRAALDRGLDEEWIRDRLRGLPETGRSH